ncbi:potassium-transporting ATPase subunit KdpA [Pseudaeromonas sharmana]|uniref:Potassium-transporting ATPase potassium-binding subunit n=1 Tax=Pseudaeromonas sharmana TaxID=328412 RepID=A0ABV8CQH0_9GAMM
MTPLSVLLLLSYLLVLLLCAIPLSRLLAALIDGDLPRPLLKLETLLLGPNCAEGEMTWRGYAAVIMMVNLVGGLLLFAILLGQAYLPWNPQQLPGLPVDLAFNTAISFMTNTNWQAYVGEATVSYFSQMAGLTVQNFLSAATGGAVAVALIRGLIRHDVQQLGNAWRDLLRLTLYLLLPLSLLLMLFFVQQGTLQNLLPYLRLTTLEGHTQTLAMGPVASQEAIKMLGTNGGGFFNANSAHPFENPTAATNFVQMLAIFVIPTALVLAFGRLCGDRRQGWALLAAMTLMFVLAVGLVTHYEQQGTPQLHQLGLDLTATDLQPGGNMEGKESRFGIAASSLFAVITTAASCGAVNSMHDSLTPLGGMVPMLLMQLGEVVFGGVGAGFYGIMLFVMLTVFIAGLMIGRTPEYLGKKIESRDMKLVALAVLIPSSLVLIGTAIALMVPAGRSGIFNPGPHGFSEVLYALSSAVNNNGSAFAGLGANSPFYNVLLGIAMLAGRFGVILPVLALAGSLVSKKRQSAGDGTLPTHGLLFIVLLSGAVLLVGALTFIPALALGPIVEHVMTLGH